MGLIPYFFNLESAISKSSFVILLSHMCTCLAQQLTALAETEWQTASIQNCCSQMLSVLYE